MIKIIRIIIINISPPKKCIVSPGVAGAATERPLEGVMEASARSRLPSATLRTGSGRHDDGAAIRGILPPLYYQC